MIIVVQFYKQQKTFPLLFDQDELYLARGYDESE